MDYLIKINEFEGPLDLLLHLIKQAELNIYDLNIAVITEQYLDYIKKMEELNLNIASSYLVMAAELIELKSKELLPINTEEAEDEYEESSKENLINKLIEYQKYKDVTSKFKELETERSYIHTKIPSSLREYQEGDISRDTAVDINLLLDAFQNYLERKKLERPLKTKITSKEISLVERSRYIKNILKNRKKVEFVELFDIINKEYIVITFLAILEMAKNKEILIDQADNFKKIMIKINEDD